MVEEAGALHVISHARDDADNRTPLRTLDITCRRQSATGSNSRRQKPPVIFDPIPTVCKTVIKNIQKFTNSSKTVFSKFPNSNKTAFETVMQTVFEKSHFHQQ